MLVLLDEVVQQLVDDQVELLLVVADVREGVRHLLGGVARALLLVRRGVALLLLRADRERVHAVEHDHLEGLVVLQDLRDLAQVEHELLLVLRAADVQLAQRVLAREPVDAGVQVRLELVARHHRRDEALQVELAERLHVQNLRLQDVLRLLAVRERLVEQHVGDQEPHELLLLDGALVRQLVHVAALQLVVQENLVEGLVLAAELERHQVADQLEQVLVRF